jgi:elongation factor G
VNLSLLLRSCHWKYFYFLGFRSLSVLFHRKRRSERIGVTIMVRVVAFAVTKRFRINTLRNGYPSFPSEALRKTPPSCRWESTHLIETSSSSDEEITSSSTVGSSDAWTTETASNPHAAEIRRLQHLRNVGVFAHVDAGKTTVTERMLALAGVVHRCGSVDEGNTVTDYLPAERERGITIQSAAISFPWAWHNGGANANQVTVSLIDTPGHVDFSVEVNRSVAVLDGAVLVVDSVAGVQAQTETVWRAMTRPSLNNHGEHAICQSSHTIDHHAHEPLPCIAVVNKMDKEGCHFGNALKSLKLKLPGANPIPTQLPLFRTAAVEGDSYFAKRGLAAVPVDDTVSNVGEFAGVIDLVFMRAIVYPEKANVANVESCVPEVVSLFHAPEQPIHEHCPVIQEAISARQELVEALAECDERMEELYLTGRAPTHPEVTAALRRVTLSQRGLPVLAAAALRGMGVEPVLDAIADYLPSPLDRQPPELTYVDDDDDDGHVAALEPPSNAALSEKRLVSLGHPLHPGLLALAFKVVHMKGRGGSGDGRVVFCRIYSGALKDRDTVQVISPPAPGEVVTEPRKERIGGMLELSGGRFDNLENGVCQSGGVCALVGLKSVVTGDTIMIQPDRKASSNKKKKRREDWSYLSGVASPKPVLQVRLETESTEQQKRLSEALRLLAIEDPSLIVEETDSSTLLSGLGELHIEITLDRIFREFGLRVMVGAPSVTYRETISDVLSTDGLLNYDKSVGGTRLQASVNLRLEPTWKDETVPRDSACMILSEPTVISGDSVKEFLGLNAELSEEDLMLKSDLYRALIQGCQGALKRGIVGPHPMANVKCNVLDIGAEGGLSGLQALPGALRAAAAHAVTTTLSTHKSSCSVLEPTMSLEVTLPNVMVGSVLSDLTGCRRGCVGSVVVGDDSVAGSQSKALVRGDVPLVEILGYANSLRSLTAGEGAFTAEYKGHSHVA